MRVAVLRIAPASLRGALTLGACRSGRRCVATGSTQLEGGRWRRHTLQAAANDASSSGDAMPDPAAAATPAASSSSDAGAAAAGAASSGSLSSVDITSRAVSLPVGLPTAGAVFFMAGFLKLLIMCFPYSEMAIMMYMRGWADLGVAAVLKALPLALGLAALAKAIVDRQLHNNRWVQVAVVTGGVVALYLSRLIFARPKPSPLDPMFRQLNQERAAMAAQQRRALALQQQRVERDKQQGRLLAQPDAERGKELMDARGAATAGGSGKK